MSQLSEINDLKISKECAILCKAKIYREEKNRFILHNILKKIAFRAVLYFIWSKTFLATTKTNLDLK